MRVGSEAKRCPQHLGVICTGCPPPPHQLWLTGIGVGNEVGGEGSALGRARGLGARQSQSLPVPRFSLGTHEGPLRPSPLDAGLTQGQEASWEEKALQAWVADGRACHSRASPECRSQQSGLCRRPSGAMKDSARGGGWGAVTGDRWEGPDWRPRRPEKGPQLGQQQEGAKRQVGRVRGSGKGGREPGLTEAERMKSEMSVQARPPGFRSCLPSSQHRDTRCTRVC